MLRRGPARQNAYVKSGSAAFPPSTNERLLAVMLVDSNILIYHLNGVLPETAENAPGGWIEEGALISVVARIEVLGYHGQSEGACRRASLLINAFAEVALSEEITERAIGLRLATPFE